MVSGRASTTSCQCRATAPLFRPTRANAELLKTMLQAVADIASPGLQDGPGLGGSELGMVGGAGVAVAGLGAVAGPAPGMMNGGP
jgi:hypothetical protein